MAYNIILLILAILPVVLLGMYIYNKDKDKEPRKTLFKVFVGGILAAVLTVIISILFEYFIPYFSGDSSKYDGFKLFLYSFFLIGVVEEFCKWILLYIFSYHDREYDELYDMIVYSVFIGLGFASIENILYIYDGGIRVALIRFFLAIPAHVSMGIFMGYYLSFAKLADVNKRNKLKFKYMIFSILIPSILHGIYDYCLLSNNLILLPIFLVFVIILFFQANKKATIMSNMDAEI